MSQFYREVLKPALIDLVERQINKWPGGNFKRTDKKITATYIRKVLLDPSHGFTKQSTEHPSLPSNEHGDLEEHGSRQGSQEKEEPEFDTQWVTLLIDNARTSLKISQRVNLYVLDNLLGQEGEWRADLKDLLMELQSSIAALTGSFKLAFRDPDHPDYRIYFAKVNSDRPWDEVEPMPPCAVIPATNSIEIFVEHNISPGTFDTRDPNTKPLEVARHRTTNVATSSNNSGSNADIDWLTAELKTLPGYSDFNERRHKVQQNSGVVASWQFLALVSQNYFGKPSHIPPQSRKTKKIQKQSIHTTVGVKSMAFTEAENAVRILKRYGEGGSNPTQAVIDRIALKEDKPKGAKGLYPFLINWEKDHR
ncbi:hypothetical protein B0H13DRAFT_1851152 [Mycena leptocephala]|nr:hypothetical protein B0H13DRAFT_1851152 [Mycena leptocephala]